MIGILALQGGFTAHQRMLDELGIPTRLVKLAKHLDGLDGLILPGGESTTMLKLIEAYDLFEPLINFGNSGKPVLGTCAGAILMCRDVYYKNQKSLGWLPAGIDRNFYGAQQESFQVEIDIPSWQLKNLPVLFIRAPRFRDADPEVGVLSTFGDDITGLTYKNFTAITYHPELSSSTAFHKAWYEHFARVAL